MQKNNAYEKLVYDTLNLPYTPKPQYLTFNINNNFFNQPSLVFLGSFKTIDTEDTIEPITNLRADKLNEVLNNHLFDEDEKDIIKEFTYPTYDEYKKLFSFDTYIKLTNTHYLTRKYGITFFPEYLNNKSLDTVLKDAEQKAKKSAPSATQKSYDLTELQKDGRQTQFIKNYVSEVKDEFLAEARIKFNEFTDIHSKDITSYYDFLIKTLKTKELNNFFNRELPVFIKETDRQKHTYITGGSGSGKSVLIENLIHQYLIKHDSSTVLIDPHGDIAQEILGYKENINSERIIYIDPFLADGYSPCINPFQTDDVSEKNIAYLSQEIIKAFLEILDSDISFTTNMKALLEPCVSTLLRMKNSSLEDLQKFMNDETNSTLISEGKKSNNPVFKSFFESGFNNSNFSVTKQAIYSKIQTLLNSYTFYNLIVGKSTIDLEKELNSKKLIIINLSKGKLGDESSRAYGKFIISKILSIVKKRAEEPEHSRVPIHIFIDEAQNYISSSIEEILTESRKYKLYLTLAQQIFGQNMDTQLKEIVLNNTFIKFVGKNSGRTLKVMADEINMDSQKLQNLAVGEFYCKGGTNTAFKFKTHSMLLNHINSMDKKELNTLQQQQVDKYYKNLSTTENKHQEQKEETKASFTGKYGL